MKMTINCRRMLNKKAQIGDNFKIKFKFFRRGFDKAKATLHRKYTKNDRPKTSEKPPGTENLSRTSWRFSNMKIKNENEKSKYSCAEIRVR